MNAYIVRCISLACSDDIECFPAFLYTTVCMGDYFTPNHIDRSIRTAIQTYHTITVQAIQVFFERIFRISFRTFFCSSCSSQTIVYDQSASVSSSVVLSLLGQSLGRAGPRGQSDGSELYGARDINRPSRHPAAPERNISCMRRSIKSAGSHLKTW